MDLKVRGNRDFLEIIVFLNVLGSEELTNINKRLTFEVIAF